MLKLIIKPIELFNDDTEEFFWSKEHVLQLEHSLVSISKWESKWKKPFLKDEKKTIKETIDYIRCMTVTQNVDPIVYDFLTSQNLDAVRDYIKDSMSATVFSHIEKGRGREVITSELIYYWMIAYNIPFECQKWHLERLLVLIKICDIKNQPKPKKNFKALAERNRALNEARKKAANSNG